MSAVKLLCCGYGNPNAVSWNPGNRVVQCHNCGAVYSPIATDMDDSDERVDDPEVGTPRPLYSVSGAVGDVEVEQVRRERHNVYGDYYTSHKGIGIVFGRLLMQRYPNGIPESGIEPDMVALLMCGLKLWRASGPAGKGHHDTLLDLRSYATIAEDCVERERELEDEADGGCESYVDTVLPEKVLGALTDNKLICGFKGVSGTGECIKPAGHTGRHLTPGGVSWEDCVCGDPRCVSCGAGKYVNRRLPVSNAAVGARCSHVSVAGWRCDLTAGHNGAHSRRAETGDEPDFDKRHKPRGVRQQKK